MAGNKEKDIITLEAGVQRKGNHVEITMIKHNFTKKKDFYLNNRGNWVELKQGEALESAFRVKIRRNPLTILLGKN